MCAAMICLPALVTFSGSKTRIGLKTKLVKLYICVQENRSKGGGTVGKNKPLIPFDKQNYNKSS